jgi:LysR family transcriptional regulator for bpeEF and oprC
MNRLESMELFVRVVEAGSFSKAAKTAGVNQPTVSKHIAALEAHLGAQLIRRTSRGLNLTDAGQDYYESAVRIIGDVGEAEARIGRGQTAPSGQIRVAMSPAFGRMYVIPRLPEFFTAYPDVTIDLEISERHVNLIEEGIDVALRIGHLSDSSLVARRIGSMEAATVATPAYLKRNGRPSTPAELKNHRCVVFMFHGAPRQWQLKGPAGPVTLIPKGVIYTNDAEYLRAAVLAGLGIAHNASWLFAPELESGAVTRLLKDYVPDRNTINAVRPAGRRLPSKVKVFIEFLARILAENPYLRPR